MVSQLSIMWAVKLCDPPTAPERNCYTPSTIVSVFANENCSVASQNRWMGTKRTDPALRAGYFDSDSQYFLEGLGEFEGRY